MNNALDRVFTGQGFQYLGKLSYTLYLVHPDVGWKVISFGKIVLHDYMSPAIAGFLFMSGILVSLIVAHIFHLSFEKPSLRLCGFAALRKIKKTVCEAFGLNKQCQHGYRCSILYCDYTSLHPLDKLRNSTLALLGCVALNFSDRKY